jgi:hypothetical protein
MSGLKTTWLAWESGRDDRPMVADNAVVLLQYSTPKGEAEWALMHIARVNGKEWSQVYVTDVGIDAFVDFPERPSYEQAVQFFGKSFWGSELTRLDERTGGGVCDAAWKEHFGRSAPAKFPEPTIISPF